jgi:hypothetical protein
MLRRLIMPLGSRPGRAQKVPGTPAVRVMPPSGSLTLAAGRLAGAPSAAVARGSVSDPRGTGEFRGPRQGHERPRLGGGSRRST